MRLIAEKYSILRRDAMNLARYSVCFWAENGYREDDTYPDVMSEMSKIFWSHCYRIVALGEAHVARLSMLTYVREYFYQIPNIDTLHGQIASEYSMDIVKNIGLHLTRNIRRIIFAVFKGFFREYSSRFTMSLSISALATDSVITGQRSLETSEPSIVRMFFSSQLLREASTFGELPFEFKTWSLLQIAQHGIDYISLSGAKMMYQLLRRRHSVGLPIPAACTTTQMNPFTWQTLGRFSDNYTGHLKETLFNIDHVQKNRQRKNNHPSMNQTRRRIRLANGLQPDSHMASALFDDVATGTLIAYGHRELNGYMHSNRQQTLEYITNVLTGGTMKDHTPAPVKKLPRFLSRKAIILIVDEFRTSRISSHCQSGLQNIRVPERALDFTHKYKNDDQAFR
ncbi:MAG: hypothetical protein EXX96DRAFT_616594 [Benjaminiella poitrasii]|nr:MAG: hypothetical protein EXX96DRAFT_624423 [Benjaminiella poitrasii]KAI9483625.1 MAG: hypothetical protein EXX96DRAFT_616594 [Benjaminiella poitrasii]